MRQEAGIDKALPAEERSSAGRALSEVMELIFFTEKDFSYE